jgi:type II secretory pathway component HofQ
MRSARRRIEVGAGATSGITTVEAAGRTRVVVDLFRPASYETRINGKELVLSIAANVAGTTAAAAAAGSRNPTKTIASNSVELSNVDFRRGTDGEGRILVSFSGPGAAADLKQEGDKIVLDILNVKLPPSQAKRLDVLDFATPVQYIETRSRGAGVRIEISAKGPFEQLAYQTGNEYVVEVAPKRVDDKLAKNAEPVFNGSSDTPEKVLEIRQLIAVLDRPVQQVLIESRIVIATDTFARELGVKFGISGGYEDNNGNVISTTGSAIGHGSHEQPRLEQPLWRWSRVAGICAGQHGRNRRHRGAEPE